uniref:Uncharacterized protein n=1 Tax=Chromera velia CCMP2878 TaxID=1169474 RepID=A0A0G4GNM7_9ALVE|mmetsp:Transcript_24507/g.48046  ORF Transcript_24507/g.48046 Transcript_24507/m.48046 type:complete len:982 (-) Transcript_24507:113-3058(-)|eukprot:Cvel_4979.t1-p1 / transcript=Cvel_4979.t1 / gene=Cvel_4979 / organism=Chromera_velia_CCMP2878 / gene_product=hypothetical protein / transcript_product=hypothetical protein / location=Cvel_scaffold225:51631-62617(+) / protein_length=981 / sequence_SO=supercontig / SO=protein_coding / is_pseudo=false
MKHPCFLFLAVRLCLLLLWILPPSAQTAWRPRLLSGFLADVPSVGERGSGSFLRRRQGPSSARGDPNRGTSGRGTGGAFGDATVLWQGAKAGKVTTEEDEKRIDEETGEVKLDDEAKREVLSRRRPGYLSTPEKEFVLDSFTRKPVLMPAVADEIETLFPRVELSPLKNPMRLRAGCKHWEVVRGLKKANLLGKETFKEFVRVNLDKLGNEGKEAIATCLIKALELKDNEAAEEYRDLGMMLEAYEHNFYAPFRQYVKNAEIRLSTAVAVNGSFVQEFVTGEYNTLDFCGMSTGEAAGMWTVAKATLAEWERKKKEELERTACKLEIPYESLANMTVDDLTILQSELRETFLLAYSFGQLNMKLANTPRFIALLPPVLRFLEIALRLGSYTEIRKLAYLQFCPTFQISLEELRAWILRYHQSVAWSTGTTYQTIGERIYEMYLALAQDCEGDYRYVDQASLDDPDFDFTMYEAFNAKESYGNTVMMDLKTTRHYYLNKALGFSKIGEKVADFVFPLDENRVEGPNDPNHWFQLHKWMEADERNATTKYALYDMQELVLMDPAYAEVEKILLEDRLVEQKRYDDWLDNQQEVDLREEQERAATAEFESWLKDHKDTPLPGKGFRPTEKAEEVFVPPPYVPGAAQKERERKRKAEQLKKLQETQQAGEGQDVGDETLYGMNIEAMDKAKEREALEEDVDFTGVVRTLDPRMMSAGGQQAPPTSPEAAAAAAQISALTEADIASDPQLAAAMAAQAAEFAAPPDEAPAAPAQPAAAEVGERKSEGREQISDEEWQKLISVERSQEIADRRGEAKSQDETKFSRWKDPYEEDLEAEAALSVSESASMQNYWSFFSQLSDEDLLGDTEDEQEAKIEELARLVGPAYDEAVAPLKEARANATTEVKSVDTMLREEVKFRNKIEEAKDRGDWEEVEALERERLSPGARFFKKKTKASKKLKKRRADEFLGEEDEEDEEQEDMGGGGAT